MNRMISLIGLLLIVTTVLIISCQDNGPIDQEGTVTIGITDPRTGNTNTSGMASGIINPTNLTKFQITISSIELKPKNGDYVEVLSNASDVDLRQFRGTAKELVSIEIPVGYYESIKVYISGVSITYDGNNYTASTDGGASVTMEAHPSFTFTEQHGVPNVFDGGEITFELPLEFHLATENDAQGVRLFYDAEPSCYEISFDCPICSETHTFAGARPIPHIGVTLEEGIQQIGYSPPLGIEPESSTEVSYYGIHTFIDFHSVGGNINSHTSQHVFRGDNGTLMVDAESMADNPNPLSPDTITATGTTDIRADEIFNCTEIENYLAAAGYTVESGKAYYFSLRKTWNITTDGNTYDLTRTCEPIQVLWP